MDEVNPLVIAGLFILRCLVPLLIMLGLTYLLRRFGLIRQPPPPPPDENNGNGNHNNHNDEGSLAHDKA
jgi:hypothetical protein